jgi:hypothetical protein
LAKRELLKLGRFLGVLMWSAALAAGSTYGTDQLKKLGSFSSAAGSGSGCSGMG